MGWVQFGERQEVVRDDQGSGLSGRKGKSRGTGYSGGGN